MIRLGNLVEVCPFLGKFDRSSGSQFGALFFSIYYFKITHHSVIAKNLLLIRVCFCGRESLLNLKQLLFHDGLESGIIPGGSDGLGEFPL